MAACSDFSDQTSCEVHGGVCEWCQMPEDISAHCYKRLETNWPPSPAGTVLSRCSTLPDLVRYFYEWGLTIGGILTFVALLFSGVLYLTSVGKPEAMKEAKDRATSAFLGLILLFGCWLILNTINPELTSFKSGPLNLSGIQFFECDTDEDCVKIYGEDYECNEPDSTKGDGTKAGTCIRKEPEEEKDILAIVSSDTEFNGPYKIALLNESTEFEAKSVLTYYFRHEMGPQDKCNETPKNCSLCDDEDSCIARFTKEENYACFWKDKCYTNCGKNACGSILQLFAGTSEWWGAYHACGEKIGDVNAYERNLVRWVDKTISCVRLIIPTYEYGK